MLIEKFPATLMLEDCTETWVRFRSPCACHTPEHDLTFDVEYDTLTESTALRLYYPVCTRRYDSWWRALFHRWGLIYRLVTKGYLKQDGEYLFKDDSAVLDLATGLLQANVWLMMKRKEREQQTFQQKVESYEDAAYTD